ncbi:hypothetical protein [Paenibacillus sp.]|uniref:hypothetical protein n=1 Tax=Paenibacillus sp. TaxID=58172 RepID=UPI002D362A96|nr:hypothetical protein [Paenibacillus sp.]HZG86549.1 hypothetical protein [Paenibacillus sp.]
MKHQLVKLVQERTGMSEIVADEAVETIVGYFRTRLPAEIADQIDNLAQGQDPDNLRAVDEDSVM